MRRSRAACRRVRLALVTSLCTAAVALTTAVAPAAEPYAAPAPPAPLVHGLQARYDATRADMAAARATAERVGDAGTAKALDAFLAPERRFLAFDARGSGRVVEVLGDLATADRIAVVVPGADGRLTNFDSRKWAGGSARALAAQARADAPGVRVAVVAWLGYASPSSLSLGVLDDDRADAGSRRLEALAAELRQVAPGAHIGLLCHSYGSVVCAKAADDAPVEEIALFGSPGTGYGDVADLGTRARVWAGRGSDDWVQLVPHARLFGLGFGADPVSRGFGAHVFDAGSAGHGDYFAPGSVALRNLTRIAAGLDTEVTREPDA